MYPVGNGDTTQIIMAKGRRFLFDFNRCKVAEDDKAPRIDLHKRLKEELKEAKRDYGVMGCPALDTPVALTKAAKIAANFVKFGWSKAVVPCSSVGEESGEEFGEKGGYLGTLSEEKPNRSTLSPPSRVSSSPIAPTKSEAGKPLSFSGLPAFSLLGNCAVAAAAAVAWDLR
ncbi:MAG: hypothetical protein JWQ76_3657, partial [Ramlibacter sp.]|nr:hypothetical protein [Ramlibacter sp.]